MERKRYPILPKEKGRRLWSLAWGSFGFRIYVIAAGILSLSAVLGGFDVFQAICTGKTGAVILLIGLLAGAAVAALLLAGAYFLTRYGLIRYGSPYAKMNYEVLELREDGIHLEYHDSQRRRTANVNIYEVAYTAIHGMQYDEETGILNLDGEGTLETRLYGVSFVANAAKGTSRRSTGQFRFSLAIEEPQQFLDLVYAHIHQ